MACFCILLRRTEAKNDWAHGLVPVKKQLRVRMFMNREEGMSGEWKRCTLDTTENDIHGWQRCCSKVLINQWQKVEMGKKLIQRRGGREK